MKRHAAHSGPLTCASIEVQFVPYVQGTLPLGAHRCVEVHLAACRACREELEDLREVLDWADESPRHPRPVNRYDEVRRRITEIELALPAPARPPRRWIEAASASLAATAALLLGAAVTDAFAESRIVMETPPSDAGLELLRHRLEAVDPTMDETAMLLSGDRDAAL